MELDGHMTHGVREQLARRIPESGEAGAEGDKHTRASLGTLPPHFRTGVDEKAAPARLERDPLVSKSLVTLALFISPNYFDRRIMS